MFRKQRSRSLIQHEPSIASAMSQPHSHPTLSARRILVRGTVQGVGFRPFIYRLAARHHVSGWVRNSEAGVDIHAEGNPRALDTFLADLNRTPPPAAAIVQLCVRSTEPEGCRGFEIRPSGHVSAPTVRISPDLPVCDDCLAELDDPADRRFQYAYINCTNCGPRYSIIASLPYDRCNTTMAPWSLCGPCLTEFESPDDRRFHAQPTACPDCGPNYLLVELCPAHERQTLRAMRAIERAAELLREGRIVAVKGIGGYHLACDATNAQAVDALRKRKFRKEKAFAVMVRDLQHARQYASLSSLHEALLTDVARPIVIAPGKITLPGVAPESEDLGIMLPYAPIHHLLFRRRAPSPMVLTSANRSSEPIAFEDHDAAERLHGIADAFLIGERPIRRRVDDSVVTVQSNRAFMMRRSRGYAPAIVAKLPVQDPILALGSDLKNTIALIVRGEVIVSQHVGDLEDHGAQVSFQDTVRDLLDMYAVDPGSVTVAHDLHPQFHSTRFANRFGAARAVAVQHHHAHVAGVLAEHELLDERVIGVALDGTGYGTDGAIWGCEFFVGGLSCGWTRCASLRPFLLPGGDAAAKYPVQAAAGLLAQLERIPEMSGAPFRFPPRYRTAMAMVARDFRCFRSTSAGRLFDAAAALLGFAGENTYEAQAAMWLEQLARQTAGHAPYPFPDLDFRRLLEALISDRLAGRAPREIAYAFHHAVADAVAAKARQLATRHGVDTIALSGGVFQNRLLFELLDKQFQQSPELVVLTNRAVPVNDGGLCVGQAAMAALSPRI